MSSEGGNDPKAPDLATRLLERERWTSSLGQRAPIGAERDALLLRRFTLLVIAGPGAGDRAASTGERLTVGRDAAADLVLADPGLAPFHLEVALSGKLVVLRDLGGGTRVDGVAVRVAHLRTGSLIAAGGSELRLDTGGDPVALPLSTRESFAGLLGASRPMRRLFAQLERAAAGDGAVLLEGEPGTGKRTAAAALAAASAVPARVAVEVGALGPGEQRELLAAITGGARVIATTARDLRVEVNAGRFLPELHRRLAPGAIRVPPLREREEDLALLVGHFTAAFDAGAAAARLRSREALVELARRSFPANVRDLARFLARAVVVERDGSAPEPARPGETHALARARWARELDAHVDDLLRCSSRAPDSG